MSVQSAERRMASGGFVSNKGGSSRAPAMVLLATLTFAAATPGLSQQRAFKSPDTGRSFEDRVTVTATGEERRVEDLPLSVTVITRAEITDAQEESVAELLRRVPGVTVLSLGGEGTVTSMFVRGTESDHVLALFDGVRLNSPYFAGYDWSQLSTAGVERVEVARGPYSALWGSDAVGGVVNVIPTRTQDGARIDLFAEGGEDDWQRLEGTLGWGNENLDVLISAFDREGEGELSNSDFSNQQLLGDVGFSWGSGNRVAVLFQDLDSELGIPFSNPLTLTPNRRQDTQQTLVALPIHLQPTANWNLELTPSVVERTLAFRDPMDAFGFTSSDTLADTTQIRLASHHTLGGRDSGSPHALSWGGEYREDEVDAGSNFGVELAGEKVDLTGVFLQDVWRVSDRLSVVGGARYDDTDQWGSEVSPRLSVGYKITPSVELKASYGEAFRQPAAGELFFPFSGNPDLEPERSQSAEVGVGMRFGGHRFDAALFATDTEDLISFEFSTFSFSNIEEVEIRGGEAAWTAPLFGSLQSTLQVTWLDTRDQDGLALLRRPEWSSSLVVNGPLGKRVRGDLSVIFMGDRADIDAVTFARKDVGSYVTANLGVSYKLSGGLELTARVQNLADREYEEIDGFPAPRRRFVGGVRWSM